MIRVSRRPRPVSMGAGRACKTQSRPSASGTIETAEVKSVRTSVRIDPREKKALRTVGTVPRNTLASPAAAAAFVGAAAGADAAPASVDTSATAGSASRAERSKSCCLECSHANASDTATPPQQPSGAAARYTMARSTTPEGTSASKRRIHATIRSKGPTHDGKKRRSN